MSNAKRKVHNKNALNRIKTIKKPWGREVWFAQVPGKYLGKILIINARKSTSLHYHREKEETLLVWSGELLFRWINEKGNERVSKINSDKRIHIPPGMKHALGASHWNVILFEVSTYYPEDSVRVKDYFGRKCDE